MAINIDSAKAELKKVSMEELARAGFLAKARVGYVCPVCGNGNGNDGTGATVKLGSDGENLLCGKCQDGFDVIDILGKVWNLNPNIPTEFIEILQRGCNCFGIHFVDGLAVSDRNPVEHKTISKEEIKRKLKRIKQDIRQAHKNLPVFLKKYDGIWRGLDAVTLKDFYVGFIPNWFARDGAPLTPRVIIPTSFNHYLARLDGNLTDFNVPDNIHLSDKEHRGDKEIFNFKRALVDSDNPVCLITEGEIDAMSIAQATRQLDANNKSLYPVNVIATGGTNPSPSAWTQFKNLSAKKNFIVLFDNDDAGRKAAPIFAAKLREFGHQAVVASLSVSFNDANDFLRADPDALKNRIADILSGVHFDSDACADLDKNADSVSDEEIISDSAQIPADLTTKIAEWEEINGKINPDVLKHLRAFAAHVKIINNFYDAITDTSTKKFLGMCRFFSCFADVDKFFFASLRKERFAAKQKISAFDKLSKQAESYSNSTGITPALNDDLKPSDDELAIADLDIKKISESIDSFANAAKREHKKWLEQKGIDDENARRKAAHEAYENNPPTTRQFVPDCPVDLILPEGVYFSDSEIKIVDWDKPAGQTGRPVICAAKNPIVPTRIFHEPQKKNSLFTKGSTQYEIAIKTSNGWEFGIFDGKTLHDSRAITELANYGALIPNARFLCKYLDEIISLNAANGRLPTIKCFSQPGWQDNDYKFFAYPTGGDDYIVKNGFFDYHGIFTPRGDFELWKNMFHRVLFHDPKTNTTSDKVNITAALTLGFNIGAPLIAPLHIRNPILVLGFDSGNGKTPLQRFATTFYGDPDGLCPTCNATNNFLEDLAVKLNDFPHGVDELQAAKKQVRENMDDWHYGFSGGKTRGRANIKGQGEPTFIYRGARIFTAEQGVINDNSGQGAIARVFEIKHPELFADSFAIELHSFVQEHYGFLGKYFTTQLIPENLDEIKKYFNLWRENLYGGNDLLSSHSTCLAYILTGLNFGLEAVGYSDAEIANIISGVVDQIETIIIDAPAKSQASNKARALPDLIQFANSHVKEFGHLHKDKYSGKIDYIPAEGNKTCGIILPDNKIAFNPLMLRKILSDELGFPSSRAIIDSFGKSGFFDGNPSRYKNYQKRLPQKYADAIGKVAWYYILETPLQLDSLTAPLDIPVAETLP